MVQLEIDAAELVGFMCESVLFGTEQIQCTIYAK